MPDPTRIAMTYEGTLIRVGDRMQSAASRIAAHLDRVGASNHLPYEEHLALIELCNAVDEWTDIRKAAPS